MPSRYKLLTAATISVVIRCEPCVRAYVEWAANQGATKQELIEFLNVAMTMQGRPGEAWALQALRAYDELSEGSATAAHGPMSSGEPSVSGNGGAAGCCPVPPHPQPKSV